MRLASIALLAVAACSTVPQGPVAVSGQWGGPHIGLVLEGGLGAIDYDCASGTIDNAIVPGPDGRFAATGTHRPGQGGPVRVGQIFRSYPARYTGTVTGDDMTLSVILQDGTDIGTYTLKRGAQPQLFRCL